MTILDIENKIVEAAQAYYEGFPIISDKEFDDLVEYLKAANPDSEVLKKTGWGYDPFKNVGEKKSHKYGKVLGIDRKPRSMEDVPSDFMHENVCLSAKLDGLSMVCYFLKGKFVKALTRGNGDTGIDRTDKITKILERELNIPEGFDFTGAIRGEVCISNENWKKMEELGLAGSNQRNTATGIINKDNIEEDINYVDLIFYKVVGLDNNSKYTYNDIYLNNIFYANQFDVKFLRKFIKSEYIVAHQFINMNDVNQAYLEQLFNSYNELHPCDGVVITKNIRNSETINDKFSARISIKNDEIAYKFVTETAITTIKDIRWKMSKGNKAIPVINVEPVELSGAIVQNATAFNAKYIYDNDLDIGATIELVRSGEVIPYITKVIEGVDGVKEKLDSMTCPYCGSKLEWEGVDLVCKNTECSNRDEKNLKVWVNVIAPTDGMSETLIFKFFDELNINSLEELYNKTYDDLAYPDVTSNSHKGKFNMVLNKLYEGPIKIEDALLALNIKSVGPKNAKKLVSNKTFVGVIMEFLDTKDAAFLVQELSKLTNIAGPALIDNICSPDGITKLNNLKYIKHRLDTNIDSNNEEEKVKVVITGKLSVPRKQFEEYLNENGFELVGAVNKTVKYLITDNPNSGSSKNAQADKLGVSKITEEEFRSMVDSNSNNTYSSKNIL